MALAHWRGARYFLIEPLEECRRDLEALKKSVPRVDYLIAGAGETEGRLALHIDPNDLEGSSFAYSRRESRMVEMVTVDRLRKENRFPQPNFIKVDVQCYELQVLAGARETLPGCDLVLLELQFFRYVPAMALLHEAIHWMAERNFVPYEIVDTLRRPLDGAMGQCDILFARQDHWLRRDSRWS